MVVLGLGSNLGDRLSHLRTALKLIKENPKIIVRQVSPVYISDALLPNNAPDSWDKPYLNCALRCETTLTPHELLTAVKLIEKKCGRIPNVDWGPRIIDIDLLAWDNLIQYDESLHIPHEYLHARPFALWPLADVAPFWVYPLPGPLHGKTATELSLALGSRSSENAPLHTRQIAHRIDTPQLVGIINTTPDSFSDGGQFNDLENASRQITHLMQHGAEIIDLGAESTRPNAESISTTLEWQRLELIIKNLLDTRKNFDIPPKISIDTRHVEVAEKALNIGCDWINDVSGLDSNDMKKLLSKNHCDIVFMHHLGIPVDPGKTIPLNQDPVKEVYQWAENKIVELIRAGIAKERLIFDPGIGFGKTAEQSLALLQKIDYFKTLNVRILVGHSRKSFLTQFTHHPPALRELETLIFSIHLSQKNVDYLRVHDTETSTRGFKVAAVLETK